MLTFSLIINLKFSSMQKQKVFMFRGIPHLYADEKGNFFYNHAPVPKVYNNGTMAVRVGKTKYGIKKLRLLAYPSFIMCDDLPF